MKVAAAIGVSCVLAACGGVPKGPIVATDALDATLPDFGPADAGDKSEPSVEITPPDAGIATDVEALVTRVEAVYAAAMPFEVDFVEERSFASISAAKSERGHLAMARPGRVSVEYPRTKQRIVVALGIESIVDPVGLVFTTGAVAPDWYPAALPFTVPGAATSRLALDMMDGSKLGAKGSVALVGTPRSGAGFYRVIYYIDVSTLEVRRAMFVGTNGNRYRFDMSGLVKNATLAPSLFSVAPPSGARVFPMAPSVGAPLAPLP
jgi:outer membrane lipoprotein-sorting protein